MVVPDYWGIGEGGGKEEIPGSWSGAEQLCLLAQGAVVCGKESIISSSSL